MAANSNSTNQISVETKENIPPSEESLVFFLLLWPQNICHLKKKNGQISVMLKDLLCDNQAMKFDSEYGEII